MTLNNDFYIGEKLYDNRDIYAQPIQGIFDIDYNFPNINSPIIDSKFNNINPSYIGPKIQQFGFEANSDGADITFNFSNIKQGNIIIIITNITNLNTLGYIKLDECIRTGGNDEGTGDPSPILWYKYALGNETSITLNNPSLEQALFIVLNTGQFDKIDIYDQSSGIIFETSYSGPLTVKRNGLVFVHYFSTSEYAVGFSNLSSFRTVMEFERRDSRDIHGIFAKVSDGNETEQGSITYDENSDAWSNMFSFV